MEANEIVKAFVHLHNWDNDEQVWTIKDSGYDRLLELIEQLTKELDEYEKGAKKLAVTFEEFETEAHKALQINKALHKELDAAKADLTTMANEIRRDGKVDEICCFACKHDKSYQETHFCNGCEHDDCFEWRGITNE